jgi:hypothetical protein
MIYHLAKSICTSGAYFASRPLPPAFDALGLQLNIYAAPAILTLVLLLLETLFLAVALPETRATRMHIVGIDGNKANVDGTSTSVLATTRGSASTVKERVGTLAILRRLHFLFLGIFSGIEFTLTFLTFDRKALHLSDLLHAMLTRS